MLKRMLAIFCLALFIGQLCACAKAVQGQDGIEACRQYLDFVAKQDYETAYGALLTDSQLKPGKTQKEDSIQIDYDSFIDCYESFRKENDVVEISYQIRTESYQDTQVHLEGDWYFTLKYGSQYRSPLKMQGSYDKKARRWGVKWGGGVDPYQIYLRRELVKQLVCFGRYEQDGNTDNGPEPIVWRKMSSREDRVLLLSEYVLAEKPFHEGHEAATWETCSLRKWLNETFYEEAFTEAERGTIRSVAVSADKNYYFDIDAGSDTEDRVFLLSMPEAAAYFLFTDAKVGNLSEVLRSQNDCESWWWMLRTPGQDPTSVAGFTQKGHLDFKGNSVSEEGLGVRPALWISRAYYNQLCGYDEP